MKKMLVTDTHLGYAKSSDLYHKVVLDFFYDVREKCIENGITEIIHLGDFFHDRKSLNTKTQNVAHAIALGLRDSSINFTLILGNHDVYYKDSLKPTTAELFNTYPHIRIIDEVTKIDGDIVLCPWQEIPVGFRGGYCFGHFDFIGFKMNNSYVCEIGVDPQEIMRNDFKHIYSGHFHLPSSQNNITYLGSAYQQNFHDMGSKRGYNIWDDGNLEFIEFDGAPKFKKIYSNEKFNVSDIENNIIKLIFVEDLGTIKNQGIIDEILSYNPVRFSPDFSQIKIDSEDLKIETENNVLLNHAEIIRDYIDKVDIPNSLERKTLLKMIDKLLEEK